MSPSLFQFNEARQKFSICTKEALDSKNVKPLILIFSQLTGGETEKKTTLDQAFRGVLEEKILEQGECEAFLSIISLSINGVTEGICSATTPFLLLGDVLDCLPLDQCDKIFTFVEKKVSTWKSATFYSAGKNYLLRMCNEKSGLNLQSQFNLENVTVFNTNEQDSTLGLKNLQHTEDREDGMEVEEGETDEVLDVFRSYKLDDMQASKKKHEELKCSGEEHVYFAKFLTSEKLMDLQLNDSNFRRHILLQYLILFQYLKGQVKFKRSEELPILFKETPPDGEKFSSMVEHILHSEENWIAWKNEGCPSFVKERPPESKVPKPVRKRPAPEDFFGKGPGKKVLMGNEELTRLWNLCPDNMEACKSESREFMPTLEEFFEDAIEQADPENMVEEEYKVVNNSNYGWRALRLLARRSPHFFQPTNQQFKSLPEYLDNMVIKLAKELPPPSEEIKTAEDEDEEEDNDDALLKESNESPDVQTKLVTGEQIDVLANKLGEQWKVLAPHFEMKESDIRGIESDSEDVKMRAKLLLVAWHDREGLQATVESILSALTDAGLTELAEILTNETDSIS
ncbi:hypothetical protein scyTo_0012364 [Scyliorhinus torazame]|uniref:Death domain-containing protein n=1 Tax=Scyliorhinus torazame TaxID=75743 RepID=A0A401P7I2_SCYTO|nr:hypothetical protein [Scyliorhinus torazame]